MKNSTERIHSLEFQIAFSETNLRYLSGEPDGKRKRQAVNTNLAGIAEAKSEIEALKKGGL